MKALVKTKSGIGNVQITDVPEPKYSKNEMKVRIKYAGLCGTDLHVFNDTFTNYPPVTLGHEFSGVVEEIGSDIKNFKPGDRVVMFGSNKITCGTCEYCKTGYYMFCATRRGMGHGTNGCFTRHVVVREDMAFLMPDKMTFEQGAIGEAFASSVQAVEEVASLNSGDTVLITGPGPIGLMCMLLTVNRGIKTYVAGTASDEQRLEIAKKLGGVPINLGEQDLREFILADTNGRGVDVVFECSGSGAAIQSAVNLVRPMGQFIQLGLGATKVEMNIEKLVHKRISFVGSVGHSVKTWEIMMRIFANTDIDISRIITHKIPLSKWEQAFDLMREKKAIKALLYYDFED